MILTGEPQTIVLPVSTQEETNLIDHPVVIPIVSLTDHQVVIPIVSLIDPLVMTPIIRHTLRLTVLAERSVEIPREFPAAIPVVRPKIALERAENQTRNHPLKRPLALQSHDLDPTRESLQIHLTRRPTRQRMT